MVYWSNSLWTRVVSVRTDLETNTIQHTKKDVLRAQDNPNKFFFYEVYKSPSDVDFHKTQDHYKAWADFKESGGTVSSVTNKADGEFIGE